MRIFAGFFTLLFIPALTSAQGFGAIGTRAEGMGGAFVAVADDASAEHAVAAALELQLAMRELNVRHRASGLPELAIGIAIHTGEAVVGSIGSARRLKYAAVGPNVAWSMQGYALHGYPSIRIVCSSPRVGSRQSH